MRIGCPNTVNGGTLPLQLTAPHGASSLQQPGIAPNWPVRPHFSSSGGRRFQTWQQLNGGLLRKIPAFTGPPTCCGMRSSVKRMVFTLGLSVVVLRRRGLEWETRLGIGKGTRRWWPADSEQYRDANTNGCSVFLWFPLVGRMLWAGVPQAGLGG